MVCKIVHIQGRGVFTLGRFGDEEEQEEEDQKKEEDCRNAHES